MVTFTLDGHTVRAAADGSGDATASLTLPLLSAAAPQSITPRGESERELAGYLRQFAAEAYLRGARCVITIPPLPDALAVQAVELIVDGLLETDALLEEELLTALASVRGMFRNEDTALAADARAEVADDICLYGSRP
jgi:hypothetical protein